MKKRKLLALREPPPPPSRTCPRDAGKFNNFSKARGLLPPEFPRNANISITIDTEGRPPFILPTIFSRRVSNSFGETSRNFMHPPNRAAPLGSSYNIFFYNIYRSLFPFEEGKEKKNRRGERSVPLECSSEIYNFGASRAVWCCEVPAQ